MKLKNKKTKKFIKDFDKEQKRRLKDLWIKQDGNRKMRYRYDYRQR